MERRMVEVMRRRRLRSYLSSDRRPWRKGYGEYRDDYMQHVLSSENLAEVFLKADRLPKGYGFRLDARVVEIPWVLARLKDKRGKLLDAGSSLNHGFVVTAPALAGKKVTIVTLAPESECYWNHGVSYVFGDLVDLDIRDASFDFVVCISTIEHIGMDNTMYTGENSIASSGDRKGFLRAVSEMKRILKPGGIFYVTFPFGRYEDHKWFQQFDSMLTDTLIEEFGSSRVSETIFRYDPDGWIMSDRASCAECEFFDVHTSRYFDHNSTLEYPLDYPAGERAVACIEMHK